MSGGVKALELNNEDARKCLAAQVHTGAKNCKYQMRQYIYKRAQSGAHIFNLQKVWEKINLAARIIVAIENPADVCVVSSKEQGQRGIIKFAKFTGSSQCTGRFSPGTFTNHSQMGFREPRLLIVTDPIVDHQAVREASYVNIPVIALCDCDNDLKYIDVAIPANNKGSNAIGLIWWFLTREVLRLRGSISRSQDWEIMPDLFFFRSREDIEKQEEAEQKKEQERDMVQNDAFPEDKQFDEPMMDAQLDEPWNQPQEQAADWATETAQAPLATTTTNDWATEATGTGW